MNIEQDDVLLRRYLLGELSESEADAVDERLLNEEELFELAEAVEGDLLAACARGELSHAEQERIQWRLASTPRGHASLALAGDLSTLSGEFLTGSSMGKVLTFPQRVFRTVRRYSVAASLFLVLAFGAWKITHPPVYTTKVLSSTALQTRGPESSEEEVAIPKGNGLDLELVFSGEPSEKFTVVVSHDAEEVHHDEINLEGESTAHIRLPPREVSAGLYYIEATPAKNSAGDTIRWAFEVVPVD